MHKVSVLGTGLIGMFYTSSLHGLRSRDGVQVVYSRSKERASQFAGEWNIPNWTTDMDEAINHPETDVVVIGLPNNLHERAVLAAAKAGSSGVFKDYDADHYLIKAEKMPDGRQKLILKEKSSGKVIQRIH